MDRTTCASDGRSERSEPASESSKRRGSATSVRSSNRSSPTHKSRSSIARRNEEETGSTSGLSLLQKMDDYSDPSMSDGEEDEIAEVDGKCRQKCRRKKKRCRSRRRSSCKRRRRRWSTQSSCSNMYKLLTCRKKRRRSCKRRRSSCRKRRRSCRKRRRSCRKRRRSCRKRRRSCRKRRRSCRKRRRSCRKRRRSCRKRKRSCSRRRKPSCKRRRKCIPVCRKSRKGISTGCYGKNINPFFNFLFCLRLKCKNMSGSELAKEGGRRWCRMSCEAKKKFFQAAIRAQRKFRKKLR